MRPRLPLVAALALSATLSACSGGGDAAPPEPGEGAAGMVEVPNAGAAQNPQTPALSGGPEGQTPDYGAPGGAPSMVQQGGGGAGGSSGEDSPHVGQ